MPLPPASERGITPQGEVTPWKEVKLGDLAYRLDAITPMPAGSFAFQRPARNLIIFPGRDIHFGLEGPGYIPTLVFTSPTTGEKGMVVVEGIIIPRDERREATFVGKSPVQGGSKGNPTRVTVRSNGEVEVFDEKTGIEKK